MSQVDLQDGGAKARVAGPLPPLRPPETRNGRIARRVLTWLSRLPLPLNHALGSLVGTLIYFTPMAPRRNADVNLRQCFPELGWWARQKLLFRSLQETVKSITELGFIWGRPPAQSLGKVQAVVGEEMLAAAIASDRPILFGASHLGAWELLSGYMSDCLTTAILYRPRSDRCADALITDCRERYGARMVAAGAQGVRVLLRHMKAGDAIGILPDHKPRPGNGAFAPFFGHPAYTMRLFAKLATKHDPIILFGFMERLPLGRGFRLHITEPEPGVGSDDELTSLTAMNATIERLVRQKPEQYQWTYQRFDIQPEGIDFGYYHRPKPEEGEE
ncbi:MAG: lysophospholipid acyltransferase family protein [Pseudomonadota bacterium]